MKSEVSSSTVVGRSAGRKLKTQTSIWLSKPVLHVLCTKVVLQITLIARFRAILGLPFASLSL